MRRSLLPLLLLATPALALGDSAAEYRVRFDATWSASTHPGAYPAGAHFSPLVGATHDGSTSLWEPGRLASPGVEVMAETGGTGTLSAEVGALIAAGSAGQVVLGGGASSPGFAQATFAVTDEFPLVSLVTMIAPSPDWFVGVHDVALYQGGQFVDGLVVELFAYDAGTDSGASFTSPNFDTQPQEPIALITGGPFTGAVPLGTFTFTRLASANVYGCGVNPTGSLALGGGLPELGQSFALELHDPTGSLSAPAPAFLAFASVPDAAFPCGAVLPGLGIGPLGTAGEVLIGVPEVFETGPVWVGSPVSVSVTVPPKPGLVGKTVFAQGFFVDAVPRVGVTDAVELLIGS